MMLRLATMLSVLLCATNALRPQDVVKRPRLASNASMLTRILAQATTTRHQFLQNVIKGAALLPAAATASTRDYTPADQDMKGLLSSFTTELDDKEAAAAQKKLDAVWKSTSELGY